MVPPLCEKRRFQCGELSISSHSGIIILLIITPLVDLLLIMQDLAHHISLSKEEGLHRRHVRWGRWWRWIAATSITKPMGSTTC
jgi:hypothetical protein